MDLLAFSDGLLDAAGELLARRHRACRAVEPALPERFEDAMAARATVEAVWRSSGAAGVAAVAGVRLGTLQIDTLRGRSAWAPFAGHALDPEHGAELYRDLYAALSPAWVAAGCFAHFAVVPAMDRAALDAWFALGFGMEQAHGIRETDSETEAAPGDAALEIRRAVPGDLDALLELAGLVADHQASAPVYGVSLPEHRAEWPDDYTHMLSDTRATVWLALRDGRIAGFQLYQPVPPSGANLLVSEGCIELKLGATRAEERGGGIARALTARGLAQARDQGYTTCIADWRVTNLLASRFWTRRGFRPVAYRLHRRIDGRITWAHSDPARVRDALSSRAPSRPR